MTTDAGQSTEAVDTQLLPSSDAAATDVLPPADATVPMAAVATTAVMAAPPGLSSAPGVAPPPPAGQWASVVSPPAPVGGYDPGAPFGPGGGGGAPGAPAGSGALKPTLIALAIVAVALIALVAAAFLTAGSDGKQADSGKATGGTTTAGATTGGESTGDGLAEQVTALLGPVSEAQTAVNEAVAAAEASEESLGAIQAAGEALASAVTAAEDAAAGLPQETEADQVIVTALVTGLGALGDYADALAALPADPDDLTPAAATAIAAAGQEATDALEGFATIGGEATAAMAGGLVAPEAYDEIEALAGAQAKQAAVEAYLKKVEALLEKSGAGREALVKAVNGISGRTLDPRAAGKLTDAAYENRTAILKGVKALRPPADARAKRIKKHFRDAMSLSLKADTAYAYWVLYAHDEYYRSPEGYKGAVAQTADYKAGVRWSTRASAAKAKLLKAYNELATKYGLRHDWTEEDI